VLMVKDNRRPIVLDIQDERGIDSDIDRLRRRPLKTPYELSAHHCLMFVEARLRLERVAHAQARREVAYDEALQDKVLTEVVAP